MTGYSIIIKPIVDTDDVFYHSLGDYYLSRDIEEAFLWDSVEDACANVSKKYTNIFKHYPPQIWEMSRDIVSTRTLSGIVIMPSNLIFGEGIKLGVIYQHLGGGPHLYLDKDLNFNPNIECAILFDTYASLANGIQNKTFGRSNYLPGMVCQIHVNEKQVTKKIRIMGVYSNELCYPICSDSWRFRGIS